MVIHGDCLEILPTLDADSIDACVTDPPYSLQFMGKSWDGELPGLGHWAEVLRVLKPGAHLLAFGGTRTFHRLTCAIEDAGFEVRDCLMWLYGSGFPKSHNLSGDWQGFGTALKPAWEPVILARKPLIGTVARNVAEYGTGAVNVDGCRVGIDSGVEGGNFNRSGRDFPSNSGRRNNAIFGKDDSARGGYYSPSGRWPANLLLDEEAAAMLDAQTAGAIHGAGHRREAVVHSEYDSSSYHLPIDRQMNRLGDSGGASRFFYKCGAIERDPDLSLDTEVGAGSPLRFMYCAKASRRERNAGLEGMEEREVKHYQQTMNNGSGGLRNGDGSVTATQNHHPTVKPLSLMRYLCRLVTPPGGIILDPFMGSGTTGCAAVLEGFDFVGIEREAEYVEIARRRMEHWAAQETQESLL